MGTLEFHFTPEERDRLTADNDNIPAGLRELVKLNKMFAGKPDRNRSRDGYGKEDGCKQ